MKDAFILQQARAKTTAFMARAANEPDFMQATAGHITSLHVDLAHERDKTARLERQVNAMGVLKLRLAVGRTQSGFAKALLPWVASAAHGGCVGNGHGTPPRRHRRGGRARQRQR